MDKPRKAKLFENVYRTRDYIVKQELYLIVNAEQNNAVLSVDTHYRRTLERDSKYQLLYKERRHPFFWRKWVKLMISITAAPRPVEYTDPATPMSISTTKT